MHSFSNCRRQAFVAVFLFVMCFLSEFCAYADSSIVAFTAIGKVESIYKDRVSMNILYIIASNSEEIGLATGSWVSFDLPRGNVDRNSRRDRQISFGNVIEVSLIGNVTTEYEIDEEEDENGHRLTGSSGNPTVLLWTAQSVKKVKNPKDYLPKSETDNKKGRKKDKKKEEEPLKIWTQEETIRGKILVKTDKEGKETVYLKEDRLGKRDKGLEIISESWSAKLKDYKEQRVVMHGVSHRTSLASGTFDVSNVLKVYPK